MENKKPDNPKLIESDAIRSALETIMKRNDKQREQLAPKVQRLLQILKQQQKRKET